MHYPGEVHFLPPDPRPGGDHAQRRHVLLANCGPASAVATFAFASRQATEASWGAPNVLINPAATKYLRTGLEYPTYVYPTRIVSVDPECLGDFEGKIIDEMPLIRDALGRALGLGTGTSAGHGPAAGSWRGKIVLLDENYEQELGTRLAVVVSDPEYSRAERYQNVVPIVSGAAYEADGTDVLIGSETTSWLREVREDLAEAVVWTEAVFAVFHHEEIVAFSPACVDDATMAELDRALVMHFEL